MIEHFPSFSFVADGVQVKVDMSRMEKNFQQAQYQLDSMVMRDMVPYMPKQTGTLVNMTSARSAALAGTGLVCAAAPPYGRFQYMGKVMVDEMTGSPWARKGAKKVVTDQDLKYGNPQATARWFDTAKAMHGKQWVEQVKKIAGGG